MSERYSPAWVGSLQDRIDYLERLLSRAYPWLHNPYHGTTDIANMAEGDAVIEAVQFAIQHVPDEPDQLLSLPCGSCDGTGKIDLGITGARACPNCTPQVVECGADDGSTVCVLGKGHPIPHLSDGGRRWI